MTVAPRWAAGIDPDFLLEYGRSAVQYHPPYMGREPGQRWRVYEAWKILRGPNAGACQYESRAMRWWHPADLVLFVRDRLRARREFGVVR